MVLGHSYLLRHCFQAEQDGVRLLGDQVTGPAMQACLQLMLLSEFELMKLPMFDTQIRRVAYFEV